MSIMSFLPVASRSRDSLLPGYRSMVEDAVFAVLGRPVFFDAAVELVMGRIAARIDSEARDHSCTFVPQVYPGSGGV